MSFDIPVKVTTSFDAQPGSPGAKTSEFYITLIKGLAGLTLGTGWVTGHDPLIQMAGLSLTLIVSLAYVYSRTKLKLAVLAPAIDSFVKTLSTSSSSTPAASPVPAPTPALAPTPAPVEAPPAVAIATETKSPTT